MGYITIYNILDEGVIYYDLIIIITILFFIVYCFIKCKIKIINNFFTYTLLFYASVGLIATLATYFYKLNLRKIYENKDYKVVEGVIENYTPFIDKKQSESFSVEGVKFTINYYGGFSEVGKVYNGLRVKIYYENGSNKDGSNLILRLDKER